MEHILISPGKLKLMLTKSDMEHYELDTACSDSEENIRRGALTELLSDVKAISGFDAASDKVFIQLYPSKDGGGELYITRLTRGGGEAEESGASVRLTKVYAFPSMSALLEGCARIGNTEELGSVSAWHGELGCYLLCERSVSYREYLRSERTDVIESLIGEWGRRVQDGAAQYYVREHCRCILERDAVSVLGRLC